MKKRDEILVGIVTMIALVVVIIGSLWLARGGLSKGYPLYAKFPWGAGLKQGQAVLLAGVNVGYVDDVALDPNGKVVTTMRIINGYKVPRGSTAQVVPNGIFGDMAVAIMPVTPGAAPYAEGDTLPSLASAPGMTELTTRADSVGRSIGLITAEMQRELVTAGGIRDLHKALAGTNQLVAQLSAIAAEQNRQLSATLSGIRTAINPEKVDSTVTNLRTASANMAAMTADLRTTNAKLDSILNKLDSGNGTAAKLLNDPTVYNDVHALLQHLDSLTADFKANPRKYINLKIF